jgi:hypothetical protein
MRRDKALALTILLTALPLRAASAPPEPSRLVVWAWQRPEDLRFLRGGAEIAVQTGFIELSGARIDARGRRFPLLADPDRVTTSVVHVQIDPRRPLDWSRAARRKAADAVLQFARARPTPWVQIDFEARASQRQVVLDLLHDVRAGLPTTTRLSMTALASWCDTETWLSAAPVDEIVPMLFRMGPMGGALRARLAAGGDFAEPRCRTALAISTDAPITRAPAGRRVYLFDPESWRAADYDVVRKRIASWDDG